MNVRNVVINGCHANPTRKRVQSAKAGGGTSENKGTERGEGMSEYCNKHKCFRATVCLPCLKEMNEAAIKQAVAAEREACSKIANETYSQFENSCYTYGQAVCDVKASIADAIRQRGEK